jgi:tRNA-specific 2-thiouridylase
VDEKTLLKKSGLLKRYPGGEIMGEHSGIHNFTCGQSKGLGLTHHEKMFVIKIDPISFDVWLGDEKHLYQARVSTRNPHLLGSVQDGEILSVKIRYSQKGSLAKAIKTENGFDFEFQEPQRAVTPGQAAVFYRKNQLLGGSWIY